MALLSLNRVRPERRAILAAALLTATAAALAGQSVRASEYQVKAVFLFNFAQFVDWPADAFPDARAPLVIGILGSDPFGPMLDAIVRGETVRGRPFAVRRFRRLDEARDSHILFVGRSQADRLDDILLALKGRPILTVSDDEGFARRGGVVRFIVDRGRIRFRINLPAAETARLTISSKLLRLADIVPAAGP